MEKVKSTYFEELEESVYDFTFVVAVEIAAHFWIYYFKEIMQVINLRNLSVFILDGCFVIWWDEFPKVINGLVKLLINLILYAFKVIIIKNLVFTTLCVNFRNYII